MEYRDLQQLVHIRHELRRFVTGSSVGTQPATGDQTTDLRARAGALLSEMCTLASHDPVTLQTVQPEVERWRSRLGLA